MFVVEGSTVSEKEDFEWAIPQTLQNIQESICNYIAVQQQLFPTDVSPVTVLRVMIKYKWVSQATDLSLKKAVIQEYFSDISKQNATRATNGLATLTFAEHEDALKEAMLRNGLNPSPPIAITKVEQRPNTDRNVRQGGTGANNRGGQSNRGRVRNGGQSRANPTFAGSPVCYGYNSFDRECANSQVSGGCKDTNGRFLAHVCSRWLPDKNAFCLARHKKKDHK